MWRLAAAGVVALGVLTACGQDAATPDSDEQDSAAIEAALRQWPNDFNAENLPAVCGLFADDVVLVYPDSTDRGHDEFCGQISALFEDPAKSFSYEQPDIKDVLVDGDLATVWLVWTLTVRDASGRVLETVEENGVDVFRRQPDGGWKIYISHAFSQN